ncbi:MAG: glycoside hydrolase family 47 protein [Proteobacteria bacterium]|nr:glycoside hydrolase family 47 protein [Pseudomonadota bacterium]
MTDRRGFLKGAAGAGAVLAAGPALAASPDWKARGQDVKGEMAFAWAGYAERCFGADQIKPVSGQGESFFFEKGPSVGLTIVEALDTLYLMGLDRELDQGVRWICDHLSFDLDRDIQLFECNIRLVGGLLSGFLATKEKRLLALAKDLADRLLPAFKTPTGLPYRFVNLKTGACRDGVTYPAEFGTFIAEFGTLSQLTGDRRYYDLAKAAAKAGFDRRSKIDLVADAIDVQTGEWKSRRATIGPPSDSYFEYLWDGWDLFGDADFKRWYDIHTAAILKHQAERVDGRLWFRQVDFETGALLDRHQSELASFYAGLLAQGGAMAEGRAYLASWTGVLDRYPVLPEGFDFGKGQPDRVTNDLRPEYVDSCLNLWLLDGDDQWRRQAWKHYEAMKRTSRTKWGYAAIADVTRSPMPLSDNCPAYWWSEQMKYYWLLFSGTDRFDYRRNYLSTEGNVLRGLK